MVGCGCVIPHTIIGHTWLFRHNPEIDWQKGTVSFTRCPPKCHVELKRIKQLKYAKRIQSKKSHSPIVRATLHWEQDYPRNKEGYCFNPEGLFQPAEQRTEEQGKRVVFQLRGLTGIVSTWTHRERDNRQVERERGETQRVVDKE